jgi:hypothetical protein
LPADVKQSIEDARQYADGRGLHPEVRSRKDHRSVQTLAAIEGAS